MPKVQNKGKVHVYEWVRLIATILVVIGHSNYLIINTKYGGVDYSAFPFSEALSNCLFTKIEVIIGGWIYSFHMPLFFMLSGAIFALKPIPSFRTLINKKANRLLIPYIFYGLLFMLPIKYFSGFYAFPNLKKAVLSFFIRTDDSGHLWFLPTLFFCFIIFWLLNKAAESLRINNSIIVLVSVALYFFSKIIPTNILALNKILTYFIYFVIGYFFEKTRKQTNVCESWLFAITSSFISAIMLITPRIINVSIANEIKTVVLCLTTFYISDLLSKYIHNICSNKFNVILLLHIFVNGLSDLPFAIALYYICRILGVIVVSIALGEGINSLKAFFKKIRSNNRAI